MASAYEEYVAWLEGSLDPLARRDLAERLAQSPRAAAELADLRRFSEEMDDLPAHDYMPAEGAMPSRSTWILPIAAGLALGLGFLWFSTAQQDRGSVTLRDSGRKLVVKRNGSVPAVGALPVELQQALRDSGRSPDSWTCRVQSPNSAAEMAHLPARRRRRATLRLSSPLGHWSKLPSPPCIGLRKGEQPATASISPHRMGARS